MAVPISMCCLLACPRVQPAGWQTRFSWTEVAEPDATVAKEFLELEIDHEGLAIGETDTDVLVATIHPGHIEHSPLITHADMEVPDDEDRRHPWELFVICGIFADNGQCYSGSWNGYGALDAYVFAWKHYQTTEGRTLWLAGAHPTLGEVAVERADWSPTFADPTCRTDEAMRSRLAELIPTGA
jgi:hypothetical protein